MNISKYGSKIRNFISNNQELIEEYEATQYAVPIEYCIDDVAYFFNTVLSIDKNADLNKSFKDALLYCIRYNSDLSSGFDSVISNAQTTVQTSNSTQQYFKEINDIYTKHNNNYNIEYCPENRNKLIEMNLKTVISIAKKYQGLGLDLNELISAGNLGLVIAYDKFDPNRSKLKDNMLSVVEDMDDEFDFTDLITSMGEYVQYGDIKKKLTETFKQGQIYKKNQLIKWINSNIANAKFNSIASMWIRAYILIEIDNNSRVVKKPKSEIYKDREKFGSYKREQVLDIDSPLADDTDTSFGDLMYMEDDYVPDMDVHESYDVYKNGLNKLLTGVKARDRSIFLKKFGIGLPRPMTPKEIADQEGLSIARISQIFQTVIEQMQRNQIEYDVDPDVLFDAVNKFK